MRIDLFLVEKGYFKTRSKAALAIKAEAIYVNGRLVTKNGFEVTDADKLEVRIVTDQFVSRGGYKLKRALEVFSLDFNDKVILDIGASTGGFTDCALQYGAKKVYAVDTGTGQLAPSLCENEKVINLEQTNILEANITETIDFIVMDVSFVSIRKMIPALLRYLTNDNTAIVLVKPQFEVGKGYLKNGIVKDPKMHLNVLKQVTNDLYEVGIYTHNCIVSPLQGGSGNKEFLILLNKMFHSPLLFKDMNHLFS